MQTTMISLQDFPVKPVLHILLGDKTTKKNIIWATDSYASLGKEFAADAQITTSALIGLNPVLLQPRVLKNEEQQQERTTTHAEVFTPAWICNQMNSFCDEEWFGRKNVFNTPDDHEWLASEQAIEFPKRKTWKHYVDSRRLEITCGEAPFIVSRYDASTGLEIPVPQRIGLLDRKLRVVNENAADEEEWLKWVLRAFQSVYGYEYQGDNLLLARINLLLSFSEYLEERWKRKPTIKELKKVSNVISWNIWQMDGLKGTVPLGEPEEIQRQITMEDLLFSIGEDQSKKISPHCKIYDWRGDRSLLFDTVGKGRKAE